MTTVKSPTRCGFCKSGHVVEIKSDWRKLVGCDNPDCPTYNSIAAAFLTMQAALAEIANHASEPLAATKAQAALKEAGL